MKELNKILLSKINKKRIDLVKYFEEKGVTHRSVDSENSSELTRLPFCDFFKMRLKDYNYLADRIEELKSEEYYFSSESEVTRDIITKLQRDHDI